MVAIATACLHITLSTYSLHLDHDISVTRSPSLPTRSLGLYHARFTGHEEKTRSCQHNRVPLGISCDHVACLFGVMTRSCPVFTRIAPIYLLTPPFHYYVSNCSRRDSAQISN